MAIRTGNYVAPSKETFERSPSDARAPRRRRPQAAHPSTLASYRDMLRDHVYPRIGRLPMQRITAAHLDRMYAELLTRGRLDGTGGVSPPTAGYIATIVRAALRTPYRWGDITANRPTGRSRLRLSTPRRRSWTVEQLRTILDSTSVDRLFAAYYLPAMTGYAARRTPRTAAAGP